MRWSTKFCADRTVVALAEASVSEMSRDVDVEINGEQRGRVSLLRSHVPGVAIGSAGVLVWGGVRLYWIEKEAVAIARSDMTEEVIGAFELSAGRWLIVFELSAGLWQPGLGVTSRVDVDDVVTSMLWSGSELLLRDFSGKAYRVELSTSDVLEIQKA